jgi:hypothetical protein
MSSSTAMLKHTGAVAEYRSSEGRSVEVPFRGPIAPCVLDLLGGLRSACTYVGANALKELSKVRRHVLASSLHALVGSCSHAADIFCESRGESRGTVSSLFEKSACMRKSKAGAAAHESLQRDRPGGLTSPAFHACGSAKHPYF